MRLLRTYCCILVLAAVVLELPKVSLAIAGQLPTDEPASISSTKADSMLSQLIVPGAGGASPHTQPPEGTTPAALPLQYGDRSSVSSSSECEPPASEAPQPKGIPLPALPDGEQPNFIVIMTDDQGWDDIGYNNPKYVRTPNLDNFIRQGTLFDNFYVNSQCQPSRAALYTGRSFPRTGVMIVNGGGDFINSREANIGKIMSDTGYSTAHVGKWHNNKVMGYEPWQSSVGYQQTWYPMGSVDGMINTKNGGFVPKYTNGRTAEADMMDAVLYFLRSKATTVQTSSSQSSQSPAKPFYMSFAMHAIHTSTAPGRPLRDYPARFKQRFNDPFYADFDSDTLDAWAMLEYMDEVLGSLFTYLKESGLDKTTYVMIMSDNGSSLSRGEIVDRGKKLRMPSSMQGGKSSVTEGGIRNYLVVQGPGVASGVFDSTLLDVTDILPTVADLAGLPRTKHLPWDGVSFKHLLVGFGPEGLPANGRRGDSLANTRQQSRFLFYLGPQCWSSDAVPLLGPDRQVIRPQTMFDYDLGGVAPYHERAKYTDPEDLQRMRSAAAGSTTDVGFERCLAGRFKDLKWVGETGKVYRLQNGSHIELPCNELPEKQAAAWAAAFQKQARGWWESIVQEPASFLKPTFYAGLGSPSRKVSNVLAMGAHERTPGSIKLMQNGLKGFQHVGDRACYKLQVLTAGRYNVTLQYTSRILATFKLSVGYFSDMLNGTAPNLVAQLPAQPTIMRGMNIGALDLPAGAFADTEACLEMVETSQDGISVFKNLANIQIRLMARGKNTPSLDSTSSQVVEESGPANNTEDSGAATTAPVLSFASLDTSSKAPLRQGSNSGSHATGAGKVAAATKKLAAAPVAVPAPGVDLSKKEYSWLLGPLQQQLLQRQQQQQLLQRQQQQQLLQRQQQQQQRGSSAGKQQQQRATPQSAAAAAAAAWQELRLEHAWPDGQPVLESMYSPYDFEGISDCAECQPQI